MKKVTASHTSHGASAVGKNGTAAAAGRKLRLKRPDFLANLERLGYSEKVGARMLEKFHDALS
jgi:hypothetical protein